MSHLSFGLEGHRRGSGFCAYEGTDWIHLNTCASFARGVSTAVVPRLLKRYSEWAKTGFLAMATQHSNWDLPMQAAPQHLRETLVYYSAITACCRITAASQTHLPGHQYLICFPSLRWKCHCLSDPKVPICYQRVVQHMQERADLEM